MKSSLKMHDVVALLVNKPKEKLKRGHVGTIVETWAPGVFEVEFSDSHGQAFAFAELREDELLLIHDRPVSKSRTRKVGARRSGSKRKKPSSVGARAHD